MECPVSLNQCRILHHSKGLPLRMSCQDFFPILSNRYFLHYKKPFRVNRCKKGGIICFCRHLLEIPFKPYDNFPNFSHCKCTWTRKRTRTQRRTVNKFHHHLQQYANCLNDIYKQLACCQSITMAKWHATIFQLRLVKLNNKVKS